MVQPRQRCVSPSGSTGDADKVVAGRIVRCVKVEYIGLDRTVQMVNRDPIIPGDEDEKIEKRSP